MSGHVVKVMVVDDHKLVRLGIRDLLATTHRYQVVGEASDVDEAVIVIAQAGPDILILNHSPPQLDGVRTAPDLRRIAPRMKILLFSQIDMTAELSNAASAGINGVVLKSQRERYFLSALEAIADGRRYFLPARGQVRADTKPSAELSPREREVVKLLAEGNQYGRIASRLGVTTRTVECFRTSAMEKLRMARTVELVRYAVRAGLVSE